MNSLSGALGQQFQFPVFSHQNSTRPASSHSASESASTSTTSTSPITSQSTSIVGPTWSLPSFTHNYAQTQTHQSPAPAGPAPAVPNFLLRRSASELPLNFTSNVTMPMPNNVPSPASSWTTGASRAFAPPSVPFPAPLQQPPSSSSAVLATDEHSELLKGLMLSFQSYKKLVEGENKRRMSWEQGREAALVARQAELERQIAEMQKEIEGLKDTTTEAEEQTSEKNGEGVDMGAALRSSSLRIPSPPTPSTNSTPGYPITPITPSSISIPPMSSLGPSFSFAQKQTEAEDADAAEDFEQGSSRLEPPIQAPVMVEAKKRSRPPSPVREEGADPIKIRKVAVSNIQTIQAAIRNHILLCMDVSSDKILPPTHDENVPLHPPSPVRFVWAKTTKKSEHNTRMKDRVLIDLNQRRAMYPLILNREFAKIRLETAYEQAYSTLRARYMAQGKMMNKPMKGKPVSKPPKGKGRKSEDPKVVRQRRISRKKLKLARRIAVRDTTEEYSNPTYDPAFTLDCMSSDESGSESEDSPTFPLSSARFLRSRYPAWRSQRLHTLYQVVDAKDSAARSEKPQRGVQRLDRRKGEVKSESEPPPPGAPRWMVSKHWLRGTSAGEVKLEVGEDDAMVGKETERALALAQLGEESEDES